MFGSLLAALTLGVLVVAVPASAAEPDPQVRSVDAGGGHACAVLGDDPVTAADDAGTVSCWGNDRDGQSSPPDELPPATAIASSAHHVCALLGDDRATEVDETGTVRCWGADSEGETIPPDGLPPVTALAAGTRYTCAVLGDDPATVADDAGTVSCWGRNPLGPTDPPADLPPAAAISGGESHMCVLLADDRATEVDETGAIRCWGSDDRGQSSPPGDLPPAGAVTTGGVHSCAVLADDPATSFDEGGAIRCWGDPGEQSTPPYGLPPAAAVAAGTLHTCALFADEPRTSVDETGTVRCWGLDLQGQSSPPDDLPPATALSAAYYLSCALLADDPATGPDEDGTVRCWGDDTDGALGHEPVFVDASPPAGVEDSAYSYAFSAEAAPGVTGFGLVSGDLPPGLTLSEDGELSGTPTTGGTFAFTVATGNSVHRNASTPVSVIIAATNDQPVAADDSAATSEDTAVTVDVLGNDGDEDGDALRVSGVTEPTNGDASVDPAGTITYTPDADVNGTDSFTYTVDDGNGGADTATVTVTVAPANDAPVAVDDSVVTDEDTAVTVEVLANDSDGDGDAITVVAVTEPSNGAASVDPDGDVAYTPEADFTGTDSFTYVLSDGSWGATATVTVIVEPVNDPPAAVDDSAVTYEDAAVRVDVLANDSDAEADPMTVVAVTDPSNGAATVNTDGTVTYAPEADFGGDDSFTYTVDDGIGGTDTAMVTVLVAPVADDVLAQDDDAETDEDTAVTVDVLANDRDGIGDALSVLDVTDPSNGDASIDAAGTVTYTPDADFTGDDSFTYVVGAAGSGMATAAVTVTVQPVNDAPVADGDEAATGEDTAVTVDVLANDSDVEGDALSVDDVTSPSNGEVSVDSDGAVTYTPDADFNGTDAFDYTVGDENGGTTTASVTMTVAPVNDPPAAVADSAATDVDTAVTVDVLANDSDVEGDALSVDDVTEPSNGEVSVDSDGAVTYSPEADFTGTDAFTYVLGDGNGGVDTAEVTVTVGPANNPPAAADDHATTDVDTAVTVDVLANDSDRDGDELTIAEVHDGEHGTVTVAEGATIAYAPAAGYTGTDAFTYTVGDGNGGTATATVTVEVGHVDDPAEDPPADGGDDQLPDTGAGAATLNVLALALACGGAVLMLARRRHRPAGR